MSSVSYLPNHHLPPAYLGSKGMNAFITASLLAVATALSYFFFAIMHNPTSNIALIYILAVFLTARYTTGYLYGLFASLFGVVCVNFLFTYPFFQLDFTLTGYPITFVAMFTISSVTSALTSNMKVKEKMRAYLLRAISHDLRTPLTSIIGSGAVYLENSSRLTDLEKTDLVSHILEDSNWLLNMVENLLSVTRINNETAKVNKSLEPVEEVLSEAVIRLRKRLPDLAVRVRVPDDVLMVPMDAVLIEQVLINLIENAIVHSQSTEPVECYVEDEDTKVAFHVRDYGIGIPPEKLVTIFDGSSYSWTASASADGRKGMGIGLSICKTIINAHGGSIGAVNQTVGAEFYFTLPKEEPNIGA